MCIEERMTPAMLHALVSPAIEIWTANIMSDIIDSQINWGRDMLKIQDY